MKSEEGTWKIVVGIVLMPFYLAYLLFESILNLIKSFTNSEVAQERKAREHTAMLVEATQLPKDKARFIEGIAAIETNDELFEALIEFGLTLYDLEPFQLPPPPAKANSIEGARYRDMLAKRPDADAHMRTLQRVAETVVSVVPKTGEGFEIPTRLIDVITPYDFERIITPFYKDETFVRLREQLDLRLHEVSKGPKLTLPRDYKGDLMDYARGTPLQDVLEASVPSAIPDNQHTLIVGGTGSGKTSLIQRLILHYLEQDVSLVVVDSQTDLIRKIMNLDIDRDPILLSPHDVPDLNLFHVPDRGDPEQTANAIIDVYMFYFDTILGADLTAKQSVFFKYVARLLLNMPKTMGRNATIMDMFELMEDPDSYQVAIDQLPPIQRNFFENDFRNSYFKQTKEQVRYRLQGILENPVIAKLFTSEQNTIDLFDELNQGSIVLVDTAKDYLKSNSAQFGRFFISQVLRAVMERASIPEGRRKRTVLIIDEASEYLNQDMNDLLTQVRKYNMTCIFAMQHLDQATPAFRSSMLANMNTKYAAGVSAADARTLSADMRCTPEFILSQPKLSFAVHTRGMKSAFAAKVKPGALDEHPTRHREITRRPITHPTPPPKVESPHIDPDTPTEW